MEEREDQWDRLDDFLSSLLYLLFYDSNVTKTWVGSINGRRDVMSSGLYSEFM